MPTPHKRSCRGAAHGAPNPGVQQRKKRLPAHQTPTSRLNTASSTHEHTQASLSTNATSASTTTESNPLFRTGLVGTRRDPSFSRLQNGPKKRKRPSEEEANAPSRPKKISRPDITGLSHPKTAPRPRVSCLPRLKKTGLHGTTSYPQHIHKLPTEIALQVFSYMEDKDVAMVRSTSKWFHVNMSDRFAEYCTQTLEKKTEFKDNRWELSLTRSSMNQLLLICRIPRLAHLITSVNINFDCPNQAGVRLFDKIERAYQNAAAADRKSVLRGFNTLKSLPDDKLFRRFRQEKRLYECDYREHTMDTATGDDLSMLVEVFKELTHVKNIRIGGWNKDMRVDHNDLMLAKRRNLEDCFYMLPLMTIYNADEQLLSETHDGCLQHVFKRTMAALSSFKLMLDSLTVDPVIHGHNFSSRLLASNNMINSDCLRSLEEKFSSLKKLEVRLWPRWHDHQNDFDAMPYWKLLQFAPNLESVHIRWEESHYLLSRGFNETLARYRSPRLHSIKLSTMMISVEALLEFLKGHKDSLRRLSLRDVTLVGGAWARIWALLKHQVQLENAFFGSLDEHQPRGSITFPWKSDPDPLSVDKKRALQLGPDDSEFVDDGDARMAIVEREVADGLDKLVRLSVVEPVR